MLICSHGIVCIFICPTIEHAIAMEMGCKLMEKWLKRRNTEKVQNYCGECEQNQSYQMVV